MAKYQSPGTAGVTGIAGGTLNNFKAKHPQYNEWSDEKISYAIKNKHNKYADWSNEKLNYALESKFGGEPIQPIADVPVMKPSERPAAPPVQNEITEPIDGAPMPSMMRTDIPEPVPVPEPMTPPETLQNMI